VHRLSSNTEADLTAGSERALGDLTPAKLRLVDGEEGKAARSMERVFAPSSGRQTLELIAGGDYFLAGTGESGGK
jgi:hypothetical protein